MCSYSSCYKLEIDSYSQKIICNFIGTTKQELTVSTQKKMRKEYKHNTKQCSNQRKIEDKDRKELQKQPENNEQNINNYHLSIITLNVLNDTFQSKGISGSVGKNNMMHLYAFYERLTSEVETHRLKVKECRKIHTNRKEIQCCYTNIRQNLL